MGTIGNKNGLSTGHRINLKRLIAGKFPREFLCVQREMHAYRRVLEQEVTEVKGEISLMDAHHIDAATASTAQVGILRWIMRNRFKELSIDNLRQITNDISLAKIRRNASVKQLQLDPVSYRDDVIDALFSKTTPVNGDTDEQPHES